MTELVSSGLLAYQVRTYWIEYNNLRSKESVIFNYKLNGKDKMDPILCPWYWSSYPWWGQ